MIVDCLAKQVVCDRCGSCGVVWYVEKADDDLRYWARENGWASRRGRDYCPDCECVLSARRERRAGKGG